MDSWLLELRMNTSKVRKNTETFIKKVSKLIKTLDRDCNLVYENKEKIITALYMNSHGLKILLQEANDGLFTLDIHATLLSNSDFKDRVHQLDEDIRQLEFAEVPKTPRFVSLPALKRGREYSYYETASGRLVERDFDKVVFDKVTSRQHLRVMHSIAFGNCLFCDNDLNISEYDYEGYSYALSGFDKIAYEGKTVLILGGGDACIVRRIKDLGPSMITAVDYDQAVIDITKRYFRPICDDVLDSIEGENYQFIVADAAEYLERAVKNNLKVDIIINDITTIPLTSKSEGDRWDFLRKVLNLSMKVVKDGGVYINHGTSASRLEGQKLYEYELNKLDYTIQFTKKIAIIPSYQENWVIYLIWKNIEKKQRT
ncbi:spermine synthase-like [Styela clava]